MTNFKPVIGFDDNLTNHLQNYAHTAYAVSKMRAGRTPKDVNGSVIKDANAIFRPGLYYLEKGSYHLDNTDTSESMYTSYLYNLVQDPDESTEGGHVLEDDTTTWHLNVPMNFRQILYTCSNLITGVTTRTGVRDARIATLTEGQYKVIPTVQRIESTLSKLTPTTNAYAYVKDIAMWIRYTVTNSVIEGTKVTWVPAITWSAWRSITGDHPVEVITEDRTLDPNTRYASFGQYNLRLPNANQCEVGAKIVVDQWKNDSQVTEYTIDGTAIISQMTISPCIAEAGQADMNLHGDTDVAPEAVTFTRNVDHSWSYSDANVQYKVEKVTLVPNSASEDGRSVWAITFFDQGIKYIKRITPDDAAQPFGGSPIYYRTTDTVARGGKTYYTKSVVGGIMTYTPVTILPGTAITSELYECTSSVRWYDVSDRTHVPPTYRKPSDLSQAAIITLGVRKNTAFSVTDVDSNIVGAGQYTFEVTYDRTTTSNKVWSLERCSDIEVFMDRVDALYGAQIQSNTETLSSHEGRITANEHLITQYRNQYFDKEYPVRISVEKNIYGDNAKDGGQLIVFNEGEFMDKSSLTPSSYTINYFRARLTPVYIVAPNNGDMHTFYLPTKVFTDAAGVSKCTLVGKKIKFLLEPRSKITVIDDNSTAMPTTYTFDGLHEETSVVDTHPKMNEITFEVVAYKNQSGEEAYAWTYTQHMTNSNTDITTEDVAMAIAQHDRNASCHSGFFANSAAFSAHVHDINSSAHITAAERMRWDRIAGSGVISSVASNIASQYVATHNTDTTAHPDKINAGQLEAVLNGYVTTNAFTSTLSGYVSTEELTMVLSGYTTVSAVNVISTSLQTQITSRVTSAQMVEYVDSRISSGGGGNYVTRTELTTSLAGYVTKQALTTSLASYVTSDNLSAVVSAILNDELTSRSF